MIEPDGVDEEDDIEEEVSEESADDERLATVCVGERSSKESEDNSWGALQVTM